MIRGALVLRPEPGNSRTAARLKRLGVEVVRCPLFEVRPVDWTAPDPTRFDGLLLTSANAVRHAGAGLARLAGLPVFAVGSATASAARAAGMKIALVGDSGGDALIATAGAGGAQRLLHLTGREHGELPGVTPLVVYASDPRSLPAGTAARWSDRVALLHSPRAAHHFAAYVDRDRMDRGRIAIAALSGPVADAAGEGWARRTVAAAPRDALLVRAAAALIDRDQDAADKRSA